MRCFPVSLQKWRKHERIIESPYFETRWLGCCRFVNCKADVFGTLRNVLPRLSPHLLAGLAAVSGGATLAALKARAARAARRTDPRGH